MISAETAGDYKMMIPLYLAADTDVVNPGTSTNVDEQIWFFGITIATGAMATAEPWVASALPLGHADVPFAYKAVAAISEGTDAEFTWAISTSGELYGVSAMELSLGTITG